MSTRPVFPRDESTQNQHAWTTVLRRMLSNHGGTLVIAGVLCASVVLNLKLRQDLEALRPRLFLADPQLELETVPPLQLLDSDGRTSTFPAPKGRPVILAVVSPFCVWCDRNMDNVKALRRATARDYDFVGIVQDADPETLRAWNARNSPPFDTYALAATGRAWLMAATPATLVLDRKGRFRTGWTGAFMGRTKERVEAYFGARLPGVTNK